MGKHPTDHVPSGDRFPVKDYRLGPKEKFEDAMSGMFKGGTGCLRKTETVSSASSAWDMTSPKKERKDLTRLYGMVPVPECIYEAIMRADTGDATKKEVLLIDHYIKEKKNEIRKRKRELGIEGQGTRTGVGRAAENVLVLKKFFELHMEDEENE